MKILCLFITVGVFTSISYESYGKHVNFKQKADKNSRHCELHNVTDVASCFLEDGVKLDVWKTKSIPSFGICTFINGSSNTTKQCTENGEFLDIGNSLERKKRSALATGMLIGSYFGPIGIGLGALIGGIVDFFACLFLCKKEPPPNKPPTARCILKVKSPIYAPIDELTANASWNFEASDADGSITRTKHAPSEYVSGMSFPEGNYSITYTAYDNKGASDTCGLSFQVKVVKCLPLPFPRNGRIECDSSSYMYGTKCEVTCDDGYSTSSTVYKCGITGSWDPSEVSDCKGNICHNPPDVVNGYHDCKGDLVYEDVCSVHCNDGFKLSGASTIRCKADGSFDAPGTCFDAEAPKFQSCDVQVKTVFIDRSDNSAKVTWTIPTGTDNVDGNSPIIEEINKNTPGKRLKAGIHSLQYTIKDSAGNIGQSCFMTIQVNTLSCGPPKIVNTGTEFMDYMCPNNYILGATCEVYCKNGYRAGGSKILTCQRKPETEPPSLEWKIEENGLKPYCNVLECPQLRAPANGALSCAEWTHGEMCQMLCEKGFDVPITHKGMLVCGRSDGIWREDNDVDDCIPVRRADRMNLPSKLYYYTDICNSSERNLLEIKNLFIEAMNTTQYKEYWENVPEAQARFVNVTCGPVSPRNRREGKKGRIVKSVIVKRDIPKDFAYVVNFEITIPFESSANISASKIFMENQNKLYQLFDAIKDEVDSGHFDIHLDDNIIYGKSLEEGDPTLVCMMGEQPRPKTGTCVGCPPGKYFSLESQYCVECDVGTYQDEARSLSCKQCPDNSSTEGKGSKNSTQCLELCPPGSFSKTGLAPCDLCPSSSYQPFQNQTECLPCKRGLSTVHEGSSTAEDCLAFDLYTDNDEPAKFALNSTAEEMTLFTWLYLRKDHSNHPTFRIFSPKYDHYVELIFNDSIIVDIHGQATSFSFTLPTLEWIPFALTISADSEKTSVYVVVNGSVRVENATVILPDRTVFKTGYTFQAKPGIILSAFHVWEEVIKSSEIEQLLLTCTHLKAESAYSISDFVVPFAAVSVSIPSQCDAINECNSKPCGEHICVNKVGGYECLCNGGYSGNNCEIPRDFCVENSCFNNASCINGPANFTCQCLYGFSGRLCEIKAVDGGWSVWTQWSPCSKTCGSGYAKRERYCNSPYPDPEGKPCDGADDETIFCNRQTCQECISLPTTAEVLASCNDTGYSIRCTISCRPGLFFASSPLPYYECGMNTNYKWNHQTEDNPTGRLPLCTEAKPPTELSVSFDGRYESVACTPDNIVVVKSGVSSSLSSLECVQLRTCSATVHETCLETEGLDRKGLTLTVELKSSIHSDGSGYNIDEVISNHSDPSSDLLTFVKQIIALEKSSQILFNDSRELFEVTVNGEKHTVEEDGLTVSPSVDCPLGSVLLDLFCAECPIGSYSDGKTAVMCPIGFYQDEKGQTSCKHCPSGQTTTSIGSVGISECFDNSRKSNMAKSAETEKLIRRLQIYILRCTRNCRDLRNLHDFIRTCLRPCRRLRNRK